MNSFSPHPLPAILRDNKRKYVSVDELVAHSIEANRFLVSAQQNQSSAADPNGFRVDLSMSSEALYGLSNRSVPLSKEDVQTTILRAAYSQINWKNGFRILQIQDMSDATRVAEAFAQLSIDIKNVHRLAEPRLMQIIAYTTLVSSQAHALAEKYRL